MMGEQKKSYRKGIAAFLLILCCFQCASAQGTKGLTVQPAPQRKEEGKTFALIVGISKYKNPAIPSLQFADADAIAFRDYLKACGVDTNNVILLTNDKATNGEFWANINLLTETAKAGDKVFIYFSGHGDVENKTVVKDAYLLPYDAPKCVYPAGAIGVLYLKSWIATLSANGVQPIFIADACRSGNLVGGREGMEAAASMLKDKWQDEIKILSCQPGELSLEGKQWGNGRGVFSYHLINALSGEADKNNDGRVTLSELNLHLLQSVPTDAEPMPQYPIVVGPMQSDIAKTNPAYLQAIKAKNESSQIAMIETKGLADEMLTRVPDSVRISFIRLKQCLDSNNLLRRLPSESAYLYYEKLKVDTTAKALMPLIRKLYSAALMVEIDRALKIILDNRVEQEMKPEDIRKYSYEGTLLREMLRDEVLMRNGFLPKALFFETLRAVFFKEGSAGHLNPDKALLKIDSCISMLPNAAYGHLGKALLLFELKKYRDVTISCHASILASPQFRLPYTILYRAHSELGEYDSTLTAIRLMEKNTGDTESSYYDYATTFAQMKQEDSVNFYLHKMEVHNTENMPESAMLLQMADISYQIGRYLQALTYYQKLEKISGGNMENTSLYDMACNYALTGDKSNALKYLELSIKKGFNDYDHILSDNDLRELRNEKTFKLIIQKYLPDKIQRK